MNALNNPHHQSLRFLRYPGSKRRMLNFLGQFLPTPDEIEGRYIEPFVGGGAVFFFLQPTNALISDVNPDLINLYRGIRRSPTEVWRGYCEFGNNKAAYHHARSMNKNSRLVDQAARILFLNRTCFKGMWRHNQKGEFNVGYGGQDRRWVIGEDDLITVARSLRKATIRCSDFEQVIDECHAGDFIFADPPYRPGEKDQTNGHYVGHQFTFQDHRRLASALRRAKKRGAKWALTTSAHSEIMQLFKSNHIAMFIRGTGARPGIMVTNSGEVLITSYPLTGLQ